MIIIQVTSSLTSGQGNKSVLYVWILQAACIPVLDMHVRWFTSINHDEMMSIINIYAARRSDDHLPNAINACDDCGCYTSENLRYWCAKTDNTGTYVQHQTIHNSTHTQWYKNKLYLHNNIMHYTSEIGDCKGEDRSLHSLMELVSLNQVVEEVLPLGTLYPGTCVRETPFVPVGGMLNLACFACFL